MTPTATPAQDHQIGVFPCTRSSGPFDRILACTIHDRFVLYLPANMIRWVSVTRSRLTLERRPSVRVRACARHALQRACVWLCFPARQLHLFEVPGSANPLRTGAALVMAVATCKVSTCINMAELHTLHLSAFILASIQLFRLFPKLFGRTNVFLPVLRKVTVTKSMVLDRF